MPSVSVVRKAQENLDSIETFLAYAAYLRTCRARRILL